MTLVAGTRLGPYEVIGPLGAGGMGEVYRARDTRLDREVAVKVLPERLAQSPEALSRFEREAKTLAALSHPNLLAIHDFGTEQGVSFAVMELLDGETLRSRLTRSALGWREAAEIGVALAEGLAAAHSRGIVHRDLKPENVILTADGRVKILDFGLSRRDPVSSTQDRSRLVTMTQHTEPGTVMGTVGYMSPEQVSGQAGDARSDIFSMGCVLYEMVTGARAFSGTSGVETLAAILRDDPPDAALLKRGLPSDLARIVGHCLAKKPDQRFQSARDLAFNLKAVLAGSAVSAPSSVVGPSRSRKLWRLTIFAAAVAILAGVILSRWTSRHGSASGVSVIQSLAVLPLDNLSRDPEQEYFADGMTDELITDLSQIRSLRVVSRTSVMQYRGTKKSLPQIAKELNVDAVVEGSVARSGNRITIQAHLIEAATDRSLWGQTYDRDLREVVNVQSEAARAIAKEIRAKLTPQEQERLAASRPVNSEAYEEYLKGRYYWYKFTPEGYQKSLEFYEKAIQKDPSYAPAYAGIASTQVTMVWEGWVPPKVGFPKAEAAVAKASQLDDRLADAHFALGQLAWSRDWNWGAAEREFREALALKPQDAAVHRFYALFLRGMGREKEALAEMKRSQALDPLGVETNKALGATYYWAGLYDQAIQQYLKTLEIDPNFAPVHDHLADVYAQKAMYKEAATEEQRYLVLSGDEEGAAALARDFTASGYERAMRNQYRKNLDLLKEAAASNQAYVSPMYFVFIYARLGEKDQAFAWLDRAFAERQPWLTQLRTDPQFQPLRSDPRFGDLVRRIGLSG
jgi:eukaryotic-like serine/threonine-protein kinase